MLSPRNPSATPPDTAGPAVPWVRQAELGEPAGAFAALFSFQYWLQPDLSCLTTVSPSLSLGLETACFCLPSSSGCRSSVGATASSGALCELGEGEEKCQAPWPCSSAWQWQLPDNRSHTSELHLAVLLQPLHPHPDIGLSPAHMDHSRQDCSLNLSAPQGFVPSLKTHNELWAMSVAPISAPLLFLPGSFWFAHLQIFWCPQLSHVGVSSREFFLEL